MAKGSWEMSRSPFVISVWRMNQAKFEGETKLVRFLGVWATIMDDEIRIWDYLYSIGAPRDIKDIAQSLKLKPAYVTAIVTHDWFDLEGSAVSIAKSGGGYVNKVPDR